MAGRIPTASACSARPENTAQPWACPAAKSNEEQLRAEIKGRGSFMQNFDSTVFDFPKSATRRTRHPPGNSQVTTVAFLRTVTEDGTAGWYAKKYARKHAMIVNFAERAHNHNWELDPVTRSLLDTDFYKLLMLQFIWKHYPRTRVQFTLFNRSSSAPIDTFVNEELIAQLDNARSVRFRRSELVWLAGNTFYGRRGIFEPAFLEWLERDFRLSDYELSVKDGRFHLSFDGLWTDTTMWELYSLSIINELRTRANLKRLSEFGLDILYAKAKTKLWDKIERLREVSNLAVADFGTRRRHSFLWQEYVVVAMAANLGSGFTGTSNAFLAHKHDLEAIGTNAHEIPMVLAALAPQEDDEALKASQYHVLEMWQQTYEGALRIMLPDTRSEKRRGGEKGGSPGRARAL